MGQGPTNESLFQRHPSSAIHQRCWQEKGIAIIHHHHHPRVYHTHSTRSRLGDAANLLDSQQVEQNASELVRLLVS